MAGYVLHLTQEENIMIGAGVVRRLVEGSNGDAALLYLCLARRGSSEPEKLRAELRWEEARYAAAENALRAMGLVSTPVAGQTAGTQEPAREPRQEAPPVRAPEDPAPEYSREDIMDKMDWFIIIIELVQTVLMLLTYLDK